MPLYLLINRNISLTQSKVINCEAIELPFKDNHFDYCFSVGVFEYFPTKEYAVKAIKEIERVTKKGIYIVNIRNKTHDVKQDKHKYEGDFQHIIYDHEDFTKHGYSVCDATYEIEKKFSAFKML